MSVATLLILFNFGSGLISCYFLVQACEMASLESFQELLYMFGGGRASVLFITFMQIMVYSLMPLVFICNQLFYLHFLDNLDWMLYVELTEISPTLGRYCSLIIVIVCLTMLPVIFTRQFNRIKVCELFI